MIDVQPYSDEAAFQIFKHLDASDLLEAQMVRGEASSYLALFSDWRQMEGLRVLSLVVRDGTVANRPIAVLGLSSTGQLGVAQAALLSRSHRRFRRELVQIVRQIRRELPAFCSKMGIHRIEARCWEGHPTAARFLTLCGFRSEARMTGFGASGLVTFVQFAWTPLINEGERTCAS